MSALKQKECILCHLFSLVNISHVMICFTKAKQGPGNIGMVFSIDMFLDL